FARFISDLVDTLDLKGFEKYHKPGAGQPPYDPAMMLKVVLYCFCTGIFSSRKMERATYRDVGVRFLAANQQPDYTSFSNFRKRHSAAIQDTFAQVVA
ncbi:transposase, partial [Streptococcus pneumoniae]|nr:transposase [Streptococcus pneumoniae]